MVTSTHPPRRGDRAGDRRAEGSPLLNLADEVLTHADSVSPSPAADINGAPHPKQEKRPCYCTPSRRRPGACPSSAPGRRVRRPLGGAPAEGVADGFAVVRDCIEGRAQQPLLDRVRARYDADVVTEPGSPPSWRWVTRPRARRCWTRCACRDSPIWPTSWWRVTTAVPPTRCLGPCTRSTSAPPFIVCALRSPAWRSLGCVPRREVDAVSGRGSTPTKPREGACAPC